MNTKNNQILGTDNGPWNAFEMVKAGEIPEYVCDAWKHANGIDPRLGRKLIKISRGADGSIFMLGLLCIGLVINLWMGDKTGKIHLLSPAVLATLCCMAVGFIACNLILIFYRDRLDNRLGGGFQGALYWLLSTKPMTRDQFPADEVALKAMYHSLTIDMAYLVIGLEKAGQEELANWAREEARMLCKWACRFGCFPSIRKDPKKGLGPVFDEARNSVSYKVLDVNRWIAKHSQRLAEDPTTPIGTARALRPDEIKAGN